MFGLRRLQLSFRDLLYLTRTWQRIHVHADRERGAGPDWRVLLMVLKAYNAPGRYYHTLTHLVNGLRFMDARFAGTKDLHIAKMAWFWHDLYYDAGEPAGENENSSAESMFTYLISKFKMEEGRRAMQLVLATANHQTAKIDDPLWPVMHDADLSILAADEFDYERYRHNVRKEYLPHHTHSEYDRGRCAFLIGMLKKPVFLVATDLNDVAWRNLRYDLGLASCWLPERRELLASVDSEHTHA